MDIVDIQRFAIIDFFYRANPFLLCVALCALFIFAEEMGFRARRGKAREKNSIGDADISLILGGVMTLLALMLGFTFSLSESRFEMRRQLVVDEANAIGTTYLRTRTVPEPDGAEMRELLRKYVALRVEGATSSTITLDLSQIIDRSKKLQDALWARASALARQDQSAVRGLLLQTLNQTIDIGTARLAAFKNRVPFSIYAVLFLISLMAMWLIGYYFRVRGGRPGTLAVVLALLIASVMWLIMDLDQPQRGMISASQESLYDLYADMNEDN